MPPKKGGKKEKKKKEVDPNILGEVDKTFYELQITDLNRKLARLRSLTAEYEQKNAELQDNLSKLDEDRSDIIAFLKRTLQEKTDEINELQERLKSVHEKRVEETEDFKMQVHEMEEEYKSMQEQLTSEIKLLNGKLNALEEFRLQRDDLMKKYEEQENKVEEQEVRHKREIYNIERKFIIGKDKLKKEMEARLLQLSTEFQNVTDLRVAATSHRVIRENIAINNELNKMLETQKRLYSENDQLKRRDKTLRHQAELHESEKIKALQKAKSQLNVIQALAREHENMNRQLDKHKNTEIINLSQSKDLKAARDQIKNLEFKIRLLEQNLHASRCERAKLKCDAEVYETETKYLNSTILEALYHVKMTMTAAASGVEPDLNALITNLHNLLSTSQEHKVARKLSVETIKSCTEIYAQGDLGFVPKKVEVRSKYPYNRNVECQVGQSFEDFTALHEAEVCEERDEFEELATVDESVEMEQKSDESQVFFNGELSEGDLRKGDSSRVLGTLSDETVSETVVPEGFASDTKVGEGTLSE